MDSVDEVDHDVIDGSYGGPYMVEKIVGIYVGKNKKKYYRVKWIDSWEPEDNLSEACQALIDEFWSSLTHDPSGGEVDKADLKRPPSNDSRDDDSENDQHHFVGNKKVVSTLKTDLGSQKQTEQPKQDNQLKQEDPLKLDLESTAILSVPSLTLKQELLSPNSKSPFTTETEPSVKKKSKKTPELELPQNMLLGSFQSEILQCCTNKAKSSSIDITTQNTLSNFLQSVDYQTQTSDIEDEPTATDVNNSISSQTQTAIEGVHLDGDALEELSFDENNVVDLASEEDDVEIIWSLTTPQRKRKCHEKSTCASTSGIDRRIRKKVTRRRRRNSEGEQSSKVPLLHSMSLLPSFSTSSTATVSMTKPVTALKQTFLKQRSNNGISSIFINQDLGYKANKLTDRTCNICKHTFPNLTFAPQHVTSSTPTSSTNQGMSNNNISSVEHQNVIGNLRCRVCFGNFSNRRDLKSHMLLHTETILQKCKICLRVFKNKTTLNQHMLIHSHEWPHQCKTCGKRFRQQGHLVVHMGKHTQNNEGILTCPHCSSLFNDSNQFRHHIQSHEAELPFKCNQCLERFISKVDLMRHLEGHNEGRPFTCPICKKSFKTKTYLLGHMQMHKYKDKNSVPSVPRT